MRNEVKSKCNADDGRSVGSKKQLPDMRPSFSKKQVLKGRSFFQIVTILLVAVLLASLLTGCRKEFNVRDIRRFLHEDLELSNYRIIDGPTDRTNPEDYRDEWWTVTTTDYGFDEPLTFHVINHMSSSILWPTNSLISDLDEQIFRQLSLEYNDSEKMKMTQEEDYFLEPGEFYCSVEGKADFEAIFPEIERFQEFLKQYPALDEMNFRVSYHVGNSISDPSGSISSVISDSIDVLKQDLSAEEAADALFEYDYYYLEFNSQTSQVDLYNALYGIGEHSYQNGCVYAYLADCINYGLKDRIAEFTDEEISKVTSYNSDVMQVRDMEENIPVPTAYYARSDRNYIPIGHVYDLLVAQNIAVSGDFSHFSFTGKDGQFCEIGYDQPYTSENMPTYMNYAIPVDVVSDMTGLNLDNGYPTYDVLVPAEIFDELGVDKEMLSFEIQASSSIELRDFSLDEQGFHFKGKANQFNSIERRNEDRISAISQNLKMEDPDFYYSINHMSKTYEGIRFRMARRGGLDVTAHQAEIKEMIALSIMNQLLDNPEDPTWSSTVEFIYKVNDKTEESTEFVLPDDYDVLESFLEYGPVG